MATSGMKSDNSVPLGSKARFDAVKGMLSGGGKMKGGKHGASHLFKAVDKRHNTKKVGKKGGY